MRSDRYSRILVGTVAVVLVACSVALVACMDNPTEPVGTSFSTYPGQFDATRVVPALPSPTPTGTGSADCVIAAATFSCTVSATNLTGAPTAMHVHAGALGVAGGVRINICGAGTAPACPTTATFSNFLSGPQPATGATFEVVAAAMLNFGTYVNIHTATHSGGEIRGQLLTVPVGLPPINSD